MKSLVNLCLFLAYLWQLPAYASTDPEVLKRITSTLQKQVGKQTIGTIVGIYDKSSISYLSFGEKTIGSDAPNKNTVF